MNKVVGTCLVLCIAGSVTNSKAQTDTAKLMEEITVSTGQFVPQSVKKSVYKVKVITSQQLKAKAAVNITQVLNTELGFRFSNDNTLGVTDVQLMGMSGRGVKILLDGVPLTDRNDTRESLNQIDLQSVARIEVVEGPMSVIYGSDALAGVVNIITQTTNGAQFSAGARVQEESAGNEYSFLGNRGIHLQSVNATYTRAGFYVKGAATHNDFRGFGGDAFGRDRSWKPKQQYLGNFTMGYKGKNSTTHYTLNGLGETITAKGPINTSTYKAFDQRFITRRWMHQWQDERYILPGFQLNTIAAYTSYSRRTRSTRHDFTSNSDELTTGKGEQDTAFFSTLFLRTQGYYAFNDRLTFQSGFEFNRNSASGARIEGRPVINDFSFFASAEWKPLAGVNLRPGFRLTKNSLYDAPPVVPAFNAKFSLWKDADLRLSYAKGYRAPALRELYFDFIDASHAILGNQNLKAERSNSINGSLLWSYRTAQVKAKSTLSGFYNVFDDLIDYALDPANPAITKLFNVSKFKTAGISFEQGIIYRQWEISLGGLWLGRYNNLVNEEGLVRELPAFNWSPELNASVFYQFSKIKTNLALLYKYSGARKAYQMVSGSVTDIELTGLDSYHWADFSVSKTLWNTVTLQAGAKNLFNISNVKNTSAGDVHSGGGPSPISYGRSYFLGITYQFFK